MHLLLQGKQYVLSNFSSWAGKALKLGTNIWDLDAKRSIMGIQIHDLEAQFLDLSSDMSDLAGMYCTPKPVT